MDIICLPFQNLSLDQLYEIMRLRQEVFVVEQDCPYLDADGKDQKSEHLMILQNGELAAYTRLVPPGISYKHYSSIGRVANGLRFRGQGLGKKLMEQSIQECLRLYPGHSIKISAQCYLEKFYAELGFKDLGSRYDEDGIPHMGMIYKQDK